MIYTVTLNPAVDYYCEVKNLELGKINRSKREWVMPGGKGLTVSIVLARLGLVSTSLGFIGGYTGHYIEQSLKLEGVNCDFIKIKEDTRINFKVRGETETDVNSKGPKCTNEELKMLYQQLDLLKEKDFLILGGSVLSNMSEDTYENILEYVEDKGLYTVVDTTGKHLLNTLKYHPFLIKPNKDELEEMFNTHITSLDDVKKYAKELVKMGALNVIVSLGGDGAVLETCDGISLYSLPPKGKVVNTVGAGDSMVAGVVEGFSTTNDMKYAFYKGIACGSASTFSPDLCTKDEVMALLKTLIGK